MYCWAARACPHVGTLDGLWITMAGFASCFSLFDGIVWGVEVDVDGVVEEVVG